MEQKRPKRKIMLQVIALSLLLLAILMGTYAWWTTTKKQTNRNVVGTACLDITFSNETGDIDLPNMYPISESEMSNDTNYPPYSFTITNTCETSVNYTVALESIEDDEVESTDYLAYNYVRLKLDNKTSSLYSALDVLPNDEEDDYTIRDTKELESRSLAGGASRTHTLKIWLDENTPLTDTNGSNTNKYFFGKIKIIAGQGIEADEEEIVQAPDDLVKYILGEQKTGRVLFSANQADNPIMNDNGNFIDDPNTEVDESATVSLAIQGYENFFDPYTSRILFYIRYSVDNRLYKFPVELDMENQKYNSLPLNNEQKLGVVYTTSEDVGKTTTIGGNKYIVLYGPGEKGEKAQLISANTIGTYGMTFDTSDIDWSQFENDSSVNIFEDTETNAASKLSKVEKNIYLYNNAIDLLNTKAFNLVKNDIPGITAADVRNVGSKPDNPSYMASGYYSSSFLATLPTISGSIYAPGSFNGKLKDKYVNNVHDMEDFERMLLLGINRAENNQFYYYSAQQVVDVPQSDPPNTVCFVIVAGKSDTFAFDTGGGINIYDDSEIGSMDVWANTSADSNFGLRPVISVDLADYTLSSN